MAKDAKKTQNKKNYKKVLKEEDKKVVKNNTKEEVVESKKTINEKAQKKVVNEEKPRVKVKEEKVVTVNSVSQSNNSDRLATTLRKVDDNRRSIVLFIVGFLLATLLFRCILWPDRIATLKDGTQPVANIGEDIFTADDLYESMKEYYSVDALLNEVDDMILSELYPSNDDMENSIQDTAEYYYNTYESNYGYTKEQFLNQYGFTSEEDFIDSLRLDFRKNKYYEEYALGLVTDKEVEKYYENDVFGDVDSKHILVSIDKEEGLTDEEAKKLAKEIIGKLDNGTSWDDVINEYKDQIINEELGYMAFNASLESAYLKECKDLKVGTYSKTPILTSYGYHIVYKIDQKDKPKLEDVKDDIKDLLAEDKKEADTNLYYKSLINMREEAGLEFVDTKLGDEYKEIVNSYK